MTAGNVIAATNAIPLAVESARENVTAGKRITPGWAAVFVSAIALMFGPSTLVTVIFGVFAAGVVAQTGWSHSTVAYGSSIISLVVLITAPLHGFLADRYGGRRLVLIFTPLFGACLIALNLAVQSVNAFYVACAALAFTGLGLWPLSHMKVVSAWFDRRLGIALGITNVGIGIGAAVYPILFGIGYQMIGWTGVYSVLGLILLLVIWPATWRWLREAPASVPTHAPIARSSSPSDLRAAARLRPFWIGIAVFFTLGCINAALLVHGIAIMKSNGVAPDTALQLQALLGACAIVARLGAGWLLDRMSVRAVGAMMFCGAAAAIGIMSSGVAGPLAPLSACLAGLVFGAEFDVLGVLIRRHLGHRVFGRVYGVTFAFFHLGGAVGAASLAYAFARTQSFGTGLLALVLACLVCVALFLSIGRDPHQVRTD